MSTFEYWSGANLDKNCHVDWQFIDFCKTEGNEGVYLFEEVFEVFRDFFSHSSLLECTWVF